MYRNNKGSARFLFLGSLCIIVTIIGAMVALMLPALASAQKASMKRAAEAKLLRAEMEEAISLDELAKKPLGFWSRQLTCISSEAATRLVTILVVSKDVEVDWCVRFDDASFTFVEAHKDLPLAKIVELWAAEQAVKQK